MSRENRPVDLEVLSTFATAMLEMHRLDDVLWGIVTTIGRTLHWDDCVLYLRERESLRQIAAYGTRNPPAGVLNPPTTLAVGHGITGSVALRGVGEVVADTEQDDRTAAYPCGGRSKLVVPIVYDDSVLAVIDCEAPLVGFFDESHLRLISAIAAVAAPRVDSARKAQRRESAPEPQQATPVEDRVPSHTQELTDSVNRLQRELADGRNSVVDLNLNRSLLSGMLNAMADGLIGVADSGRIDFINEVARELLSMPAAGMLGMPLDEVCDIRDAVTNAVIPFSSLQRQDMPPTQQVFMRHGEGEGVVATMLVAPRGDTLGGFALVLRNQTLDSQMHAEAAKIQRLESLGLLAAGIGHDFNNLLAAILGSAETIALNESLPQSVRELASTVEQSALQGRELSQQLLTFARGGAPLKTLQSLTDVVKSAVSIAMTGQSAVVDLVIEDNMTAQIDRGQIIQVVQNVLLNAAQASSTGDVLKVIVRKVDVNGLPMAAIIVRDTGRGIPKHQIKRVLDPFFTTKQKGTGMGLAVSYGILRRHEGSIDIFSEPGLGTEITLSVPIQPNSDQPEPPAAAEIEVVNGSEPCRVLVVDDQQPVRLALSRMLEVLGCEVIQAGASGEALEEATTAAQSGHPVNVAFLDLTMPGDHGGQSLTGPLREIDPDTRTVAFSGYAVDPVMSRYEDYGFDARLAKPFTKRELLTVLNSVRSVH